MRRRTAVTFALAAALSAGLPAGALGQATPSTGSAASEYGDYVPTTSGGSTKTTTHSSTPTHSTHRSTPTRSYSPPVRHYTAPTRTYSAPSSRPVQSAPSYTQSVAPAHKPRHHKKRHHPHHAAAPHKVAKATPTAAKPKLSVPAAPSASVDGGSRQLILLGLAMLAMTVAVFAQAGWRRRHGSV